MLVSSSFSTFVSLLQSHLKASSPHSFCLLHNFHKSDIISSPSLPPNHHQSGTKPELRVTYLIAAFQFLLVTWYSGYLRKFSWSHLQSAAYVLYIDMPPSSVPPMQFTQHFHWWSTCILFTIGIRCTSCYATHVAHAAFLPWASASCFF